MRAITSRLALGNLRLKPDRPISSGFTLRSSYRSFSATKETVPEPKADKTPSAPSSADSNTSQQTSHNVDAVQRANARHMRYFQVGLVASIIGSGYLIYQGLTKEEDEDYYTNETRERVVILGSGWGALSVLKNIDTIRYDVKIVSPRNYFLFTPLLPSAAVGTLDFRSIVEPIRNFCTRNGAEAAFYEAKCTDVDLKNKTVTCVDTSSTAATNNSFTIPYDHLVVAVGAMNNTFNTPGVVENAFFLKQIEDGIKVRDKVIDCFETAALPSTSEEERKRLLHFVICGGGPTGVEYAAELHDFVHEDLHRVYPELIPFVQVTIVQSADHLLNTYDTSISEYTEDRFSRGKIDTLVNTRITGVQEKDLSVVDKTSGRSIKVPFGMCLWATGIAPTALTASIQSALPGIQTNKNALITDPFMRVKGAENVYALGDCANVEQKKCVDHLMELFKEADTNGDGVLSLQEFREFLSHAAENFPHVGDYAIRAEVLFENADENHDQVLSSDEFKKILLQIDSRLKTLPTTAQVADQEGKYLAKAFNDKLKKIPPQPFKYKHLGNFAYIGGNRATLEVGVWRLNGFGAYTIWRGAYWSMQHSFRNQVNLSFDWSRSFLFGRDTSRF